MARWIRRSLWCIALGFVTAWLVAWGITVAMWAGWYRPQMETMGEGLGVVEPWIVKKDTRRWSHSRSVSWDGERFDRVPPVVYGERHRERLEERATRIQEIGGAAFAEEQKHQWEALYPELDEMTNGQLTQIQKQTDKMLEGIIKPPIHRIDDQVVSLPDEFVEVKPESLSADSWSISHDRVGWPNQMVSSYHGYYGTITDTGYVSDIWQVGAIEIKSLKRKPIQWLSPVALTLPYIVNWPAAFANTTVLGGLWFALFTGLAFIRSLRRRMAGQCPRCGYDMSRVPRKACPECGGS